MTLAIFDLDNTLIAGDSDHLWGDWLVEKGIVDQQHYKETNDQFYVDYQNGRLDIMAYLRFSLKVLAEHDMAQLHFWREQFLAETLDAMWLPKAEALLQKQLARQLVGQIDGQHLPVRIAGEFVGHDLILRQRRPSRLIRKAASSGPALPAS